MYHYLTNANFRKTLKEEGTKLTQQLCHQLKIDHGIGAICQLVGSAKRNMITQNEDGQVDMDYNLIIIKSPTWDGQELKDAVMYSFNKVLKKNGYKNCQDSTSVLSTGFWHFTKGNSSEYKFDIAIIKEDEYGNWHRLIHQKTGLIQYDRWYWNQSPNTKNVKEKADYIKEQAKWQLVRDEYIVLKNNNLRYNNNGLSSFVCYEQAVNNVYNQIHHNYYHF